MRTERSYRQLASTVEYQAQQMADAMHELDVALERMVAPLDAHPDVPPGDVLDESAVAHVARARAYLAGDQLHQR